MAARLIREDRSPAQIRVDIERTRSHLDDTVDAIGDKLSPGRFVDELWSRVQADGASAVADTLREHPIPFTLVGAGLGWLVYERASARPDRERRQGDAFDGRVEGRYYGEVEGVEYDDEDDESLGDRMRYAKDSLKQSASEARKGVRDKASSAAEAVTDKLSDARESVTDRAESTARGVKRAAERTREGFWHMLERNPVAVGAIALGAGLAVGLGAPRTRWEDERMGRAARSFKREGKQVMEETAGKVMGVAQEAYDTAREKGSEAMQEVKDATVEAARERGMQEGLTSESIQEAATRPAKAARRAAET